MKATAIQGRVGGEERLTDPRAPDTKNLPPFPPLSLGLALTPGLISRHWPAWQVTASEVAHQGGDRDTQPGHQDPASQSQADDR